MVIKAKWFDNMNLNYGATFPTDLIKREKLESTKFRFPPDTKQHI